MYAIKPRDVGNPVGSRYVPEDAPLPDGHTFAVADKDWSPSLVLAEDEQSLREPTQAELDKQTVPRQVTALQTRRALAAARLRSAVEDYVTNQSQDVQDHWTYATMFLRDSQFIADAAAELGLSEQDVDGLFTQAAEL